MEKNSRVGKDRWEGREYDCGLEGEGEGEGERLMYRRETDVQERDGWEGRENNCR